MWKRPITKFPCPVFLIIAKDCTERLPAVALSIGLIIPQLMRFGSRGQGECFFSDTPPKCLDRDCLGRRRTGTRHGSVYRSVIEKQGIVVSRQRVLQTMTSLRVVSLVFRGHGENWTWFLERLAEMEPRSGSTPNRRFTGAWPNVRKESQ